MAGYSGKPLAEKLGIKKNFIMRTINHPENYFSLLAPLPENVVFCNDCSMLKDCIHYFETSAEKLFQILPTLKKELLPHGMIWVSWYKKSSQKPTDITENLIRGLALQSGLVDIKVCAIDEQWSGLKLVIPVKNR